MNFNDREISGSTPLRDFPDKYNGLISDLNSTIKELNDALNKKTIEIENLKKTISSLETNLKSSFTIWFDKKMDEFENTFEKKTN